MNLELFPTDPTIEECRCATKGFPGFREQRKNDYIIFNYDFAFRESFPDPLKAKTKEEARLLQVRRECRGIVFSAETGKILARRFHKFFNICEMEETMPSKIDISRPHILLNKIDGCLISPFITEGKMRFGTKMGITDVTEYLENNYFPNCGINFNEFCQQWLQINCTPIFEWASPLHQIILEYESDSLSLIAIRENSSGNYIDFETVQMRAKEANIPTTQPYTALRYGVDYNTTSELVECVRSMDSIEGFVVVFDKGEMYKMKSNWYIERSKRAVNVSLFEKDLFLLVLEQRIDDVSDYLGERRRSILEEFGMKLFLTLKNKAQIIEDAVKQAKEENLEKKEFVAKLKKMANSPNCDPFLKEHCGLYFKVFDGNDAFSEIVKFLRSQCTTGIKLQKVRNTLCDGLSITL